MKEKKRCEWSGTDRSMIKYHDEEWGVPVHDDDKWFEFLLLEGFQAGLSWSTILNKRGNFRKAFKRFNYKKIAKFSKKEVSVLMNDAGIIRNRLKIESAITNAKMFMEIQKEFGSFDIYMWSFTDGKVVTPKYTRSNPYTPTTLLSDTISKDLKKRGFKFVGSTIIYAHMQATGIVNDHTISCFRYREV